MPANKGPSISGTAAAFLTISWIFILLRCYCRAVIVKAFGIDDWLALIALLFYTPYCAFSITATFYGSGKHTIDIPSADLPIGLKWWWACEPVYVLSGMFIKLSIAVFLLRICVYRAQRMVIYATTTLMCCISIAYFFVFVFQCLPSSYFWTQYTGSEGTCLGASVVVDVSYAYSSASCLVDLILGILPVFLVWNLNMATKEKIGVAMILAIGGVASLATLIRMPTISHLSNRAEFLYATADVAIWSTIEVGIAIAASAAATLRPLFRTFFDTSNLQSSTARHGAWNTRISRAGYLRSEGNEAIGLNMRSNNKNPGTVTTTIRAGSRDDEENESKQSRMGGRKRSESNTRNGGGRNWSNGSSQDAEWAGGITKTMVVSTDNEML